MYTQGSPPLKRHRLATALRPVMAAHALGDVESWPVGGRAGTEVIAHVLGAKLYFVVELCVLCRLGGEGNVVILAEG